MMNAMQLLAAGFAALASAALGALALRWWCGRRIATLLARIDKLERARQLASQHSAQARRQIEQLQKDLAEQHRARADARSARKRDLSAALDANEQQTLRLDPAERPHLPAHGFAETQPMA